MFYSFIHFVSWTSILFILQINFCSTILVHSLWHCFGSSFMHDGILSLSLFNYRLWCWPLCILGIIWSLDFHPQNNKKGIGHIIFLWNYILICDIIKYHFHCFLLQPLTLHHWKGWVHCFFSLKDHWNFENVWNFYNNMPMHFHPWGWACEYYDIVLVLFLKLIHLQSLNWCPNEQFNVQTWLPQSISHHFPYFCWHFFCVQDNNNKSIFSISHLQKY